MLIQHKQQGSKGIFYVEENDVTLAEMTYSMAGNDVMIIDHTEVSDTLRGKNVGYQLLHTTVEYARTKHIKIFPLCPLLNRYLIKRKMNLEMF